MRLATRLDSLIALRSMRADRQPDLFGALSVLERAGADGVVCRLDGSGAPGDKELALLRKQSPLHFCLAVSPVAADVQRAIDLRPDMVLFQTASASGGRMDLASAGEALRELVIQLHAHGIVVQMEVDPELQQIRECKRLEADFLLLDTTRFAEQSDERESLAEEGRLLEATHGRAQVRTAGRHGWRHQLPDCITAGRHTRRRGAGGWSCALCPSHAGWPGSRSSRFARAHPFSLRTDPAPISGAE